eukprot:gene19213-biopygen5480
MLYAVLHGPWMIDRWYSLGLWSLETCEAMHRYWRFLIARTVRGCDAGFAIQRQFVSTLQSVRQYCPQKAKFYKRRRKGQRKHDVGVGCKVAVDLQLLVQKKGQFGGAWLGKMHMTGSCLIENGPWCLPK